MIRGASHSVKTLFFTSVLSTVAGCGGCGGASGNAEISTRAPVELDAERLAATWPVRMADDQVRAPYQGSRGWGTHVMKRNYMRALSQFGDDNGGVARVHADAASLFRQAALLSANSLIQNYGVTPDPTDPKGVAHLLSVSYVLVGDLDSARRYSKLLEGIDDPTVAWHAPWKAWLAGPAVWPPDLSALPMELPPVAPGSWPTLKGLPHYQLPVQTDSGRSVEMSDPAALVALALWHEAAAVSVSSPQLVATYGAPYRLPIEGPVTDAVPLTDPFLFGSDYLVPEDGPFMAAVMGPAGASAIDAFRDTSLLAALADASRVDGKIDAERGIDVVTTLRTMLVAQQAAVTNGTVQGHHRVFADISKAGALRMLGLIGEVEVDAEVGGRFRLLANETTEMAAACPVGKLALAAWDANHRYPMRGLDIILNQSRRYPSLEASRPALDALALRVGRERVGEGAQ